MVGMMKKLWKRQKENQGGRNRMGVFVNNLKRFKSSFTGEELEYKINNGLWVFMESDFDLKQSDWATGYDKQQAHYGSIFATCLLKANGHDITFDEVIENTDVEGISNLVLEYSERLHKEAVDELDEAKSKEEKKKKNPS